MIAAAPRRLLSALVACAALVAGCGHGPVPLPDLSPSAIGDTVGLVARGEYLVRNVAVCGGCHSLDPSDPDDALAGGLEFKDWRLGTIRAANLTPDTATGLGGWSAAEIVRAMRTGVDARGHKLAPIMPYAWLHGLSDRDAYAIARYLQTRPPVRHAVKDSHNLMYALGKPFIPLATGATSPVPARAATPEYGAYLALHAALCVDCHTPRGGLTSAPRMNRLFAGSADPPRDFPANPANLTPDSATGIGRWSEQDFLRTLRTGVNPRGDTLNRFMPWPELRRMSDDDLRAIYRYLRTVPAIRNDVPRRVKAPGR